MKTILIKSEERTIEKQKNITESYSICDDVFFNQEFLPFNQMFSVCETVMPPQTQMPLYYDEYLEIFTFVLEGSLLFNDIDETKIELTQGSAIRSISNITPYTFKNLSQHNNAHFFQITLQGVSTAIPLILHKHINSNLSDFSLLASPDGKNNSLSLVNNLLIYQVNLTSQQSYSILPNRSIWIHMLGGSVKIGNILLQKGDSLGIDKTQELLFCEPKNSQFLLCDIGLL